MTPAGIGICTTLIVLGVALMVFVLAGMLFRHHQKHVREQTLAQQSERNTGSLNLVTTKPGKGDQTA